MSETEMAADQACTESTTFQNARFGEMTVDATSIATFPDGIPGFERCKRYGLVSLDEEAPFLRLLSIDEPAVGFVIVDPTLLWGDYDPEVGPEEVEGLDVRDVAEVEVYCIVTLSEQADLVTANLKGPIAINTRTMMARQIILMDDRYHTKHPLLVANREKTEAR